MDQYQYLENYPPIPPQPNINPKFLSIDCCWVRGGVGGQLPRYWYWSQIILLERMDEKMNSNFRWLMTHGNKPA